MSSNPEAKGVEAILLDERLTERRNPRSVGIDRMSVQEVVDLINAEDRLVAEAVGAEREAIARCVELVVDSLRRGGRLFYGRLHSAPP